MNQRDRDIDALAKTIYGEARGESQEGQYAVAHSVMNRQKSNKSYLKGSNVEETCKKPYQYACWNSNDVNSGKLGNAGQQHRNIATQVYDGQHKDNTNGSTHYHADYAKSGHPWANNKQPTRTIGAHEFYNNID